VLTILDPDYPGNLRAIYNRPPMLFVKGDLRPEDERAVAVVGTRKASTEGLRHAHDLAFELARRNITVLSGLARGIDTAAHTATLEAGGRTIAVMGTGIGSIYPRENTVLAERILASGGALVSQFFPDAPPRSMNFPLRNVVMSGMSIGTVVVEASSTSGAKMQARLALEHSKKVFLLKSLVMKQEWAQKYSKRAGAFVVDSADKIVELVEQLVRPPKQLSLV
jgi:DNA processing protein